MTREQIDYAKAELERGVDLELVRTTLRENGYEEELIIRLLARARAELEAEAEPKLSPIPAPAPEVQPAPGRPQTAIPAPTQTPTPIPVPTRTEGEAASSEKGSNILLYIVIALAIGGVAVVMVIMASLNDARDAGNDAAAQMSLSNLRSQAEIHFFSNGDSYEGLCQDPTVARLLDTTIGMADCIDSPERYRASVRLGSGEYFCVAGVAAEGAELPPSGKVRNAPTGFSCR